MVGDHGAERRNVIENGFDVSENDSGLVFVFGQAHDGECFSDGDEGSEINEAGDEAGDQRGDERFAATPADDEISFLESVGRWRCASGVALKDDKVIGGHCQTEDSFQHHEPAVQVSSFLNRGNEPKSFGFLIASMMVGWRSLFLELRSDSNR